MFDALTRDTYPELVLGAARGPGTSHHHLGVPAALETLEELVAAACHDAGLPADERPLATVGVWCLAGVDFPADDAALGPAIAGRRWAHEVLLHNDDYTTQEFVVYVLMKYFQHDAVTARKIMLHVHIKGIGVAGVYPYEVAETKAHQVVQFARENEMPLQASLRKSQEQG